MAKMRCDDVRRTPIHGLPDHLLLDISDWLSSCRDIHSLMVTNRRFHTLLERKLYKMDTSAATDHSRSLYWAASRCDFVVARKVINFGCSLDGTCCFLAGTKQPLTAVNVAMIDNHLPMVTMLVSAGANVDNAPNAANIPVFYALQNGWLDMFKMLISVGNASLQVVDQFGHGLLTAAARLNDMDAIYHIVSGFPDMTEPSDAISSPYHQAIQNNNFDVFMLLLDSTRCSPSLMSEDGKTPLQLASEQGKMAFVSALLDDGRANPQFSDYDNGIAVLQALRLGQFDTVALLLSHGNPCRPHVKVFTEACKLKEEFIAWKALELLTPSQHQVTEWRNCARNNGLVNLVTMMTRRFNLDPL